MTKLEIVREMNSSIKWKSFMPISNIQTDTQGKKNVTLIYFFEYF